MVSQTTVPTSLSFHLVILIISSPLHFLIISGWIDTAVFTTVFTAVFTTVFTTVTNSDAKSSVTKFRSFRRQTDISCWRG